MKISHNKVIFEGKTLKEWSFEVKLISILTRASHKDNIKNLKIGLHVVNNIQG